MNAKIRDEIDKKVIEKLEVVGNTIYNDIKNEKEPTIELAVRSLSNVQFDKDIKKLQMGDKTSIRKFLNIGHARKFMQTILITSEIKKIINQKVDTSIRDLYYALKHTIGDSKENTFEGQSESDPILVDLEASLDVLREQFHLVTSPKGIVAGDLKIKDGNDLIDLSKMGSSGWAVPSQVEPENIEIKDLSADYVLMIEKDAVWRRFNQDKFWKKNNCIVMTGKGQPARAERRLINRFRTEHNLPVYCLMDADPWGYYIYSVVKRGSISLSFSSDKLATPEAKFLGLTTKDVDTFNLSKSVTIKLSKEDLKRIEEMKGYTWMQNKLWQQELDRMKERNYKLELEALSSKNIKFISEKYVPTKIETGDFLP